MKHTLVNRPVGLFLFLLVVSLLVFSSSPARAISSPPIIALYYTWYEMGNWNYETMPDRPVPLYQGSDGTTMEHHIEMANDKGIDAFLCPWRGPDESIRDTRCDRLHERMIKSSRDMNIAYMIDMSAEESDNMLSEEGLRDALHDLREEVIYQQDSEYLPLVGRPAVFWLNPHLFGTVEEWQRFRNQVDLYRGETWIMTTDMPNFEDNIFSYLDVFDGVFLLDVTRAASPADALATYNARLQAYNRSHGTDKPFIATVSPGYDDTRFNPTSGHYRDRANGAYYQQSWGTAAQYNPAAVVLNSFNGFHTGTHIETSENFTTRYIDLTGSLIANFRQRVSPSLHGSPNYIGQSGHFLMGLFRTFWYQHGGVSRFGYPITEEFVRQSDGKVVQYFERARFELRRTGPNQAEVDLGLLGVDYAQRYDMPFADGIPLGVDAIDGRFRAFWDAYSGQRSSGYPRFFGYPISGSFMQELSDGQDHLVQYFERVRLELHGNTVVVGLLGHDLAPCHHKQPRAANDPPPAPLQEGDDDPCPIGSTDHDAVTNAAPGAVPAPVPRAPEPDDDDDESESEEVFGVARGRVYYQVVAPGTVQGFQAWNYAPNEVVSLWYNLPDGSTRELPYRAIADENGYVLIGFQTERTDPEGKWSLVGKGVDSKRVVVAHFELRW